MNIDKFFETLSQIISDKENANVIITVKEVDKFETRKSLSPSNTSAKDIEKSKSSSLVLGYGIR